MRRRRLHALVMLLLALALGGCDRLASFVAGGARDGGASDGDRPPPPPPDIDAPPGEGTAPPDTTVEPRRWREAIKNSAPGKLVHAAAAYEPGSGDVLLYGGIDHLGSVRGALWRFDGDRWQLACAHPCDNVTNNDGPGPRSEHGMSFDAASGEVLIFGGSRAAELDPPLDTMWAYKGGVWARKPAAPVAARRVTMGYDPRTQMTYVFGHNDYSEIYRYDAVQEDWFALKPPAPTPPRWRGTMAITYVDSGGLKDNPQLANVFIACGGRSATNQVHGDCWRYDPSDGPDGSWQLLCQSCTGVKRAAAMLAHDRARGTLLLAGGFDPNSGEIGGSWTSSDGLSFVMSHSLPSDRDSSELVYQASRASIVLYGGNGRGCPLSGSVNPYNRNCADTLIYE